MGRADTGTNGFTVSGRGEILLGREDILDFCLKFEPRDLTVTRTGFCVVGFINSLFSFRLFFTTNFFPFRSLITTFPILFDLAVSSAFVLELSLLSRSTLLELFKLFDFLSWRF